MTTSKKHKSTQVAKQVSERFFEKSAKNVDSFGKVLIFTVITVLMLLFFDVGAANQNTWGAIASASVALSLALTLLYSLRASGVSKAFRNAVTVFLVIGLVGTVVLIILNALYPTQYAISRMSGINPFWILIAIITPIATMHRFLGHRKVRIQTLYASISAYLQIALAFGLVYMYLALNTGSQIFSTVLETTSYMYYSLSTITTLGLGDLVVVGDLGRALSVFEAAIGQIYLVVVVAMIVGLYVSSKRKS